jgi:hypothetical protein
MRRRLAVVGVALAVLVTGSALGQAQIGPPPGFDAQAVQRLAPFLRAMNELINFIGDLREVDRDGATRLSREQAAAVAGVLREASARPSLGVQEMEELQAALEELLTPRQLVAADTLALRREQEARQRLQGPASQTPPASGQAQSSGGQTGGVRITDADRGILEQLLAGDPVNPLNSGRGAQIVRDLVAQLAGR